MENKGYAKFWGVNKVHYGKCGSAVYLSGPCTKEPLHFKLLFTRKLNHGKV